MAALGAVQFVDRNLVGAGKSVTSTGVNHRPTTLDRRGGVWVNYNNSTFFYVNPITHRSQKIPVPLLSADYMTPIASDPQGQIWTLIYYNQLWWYDSRQGQWTKAQVEADRNRTGEIVQMVVDEHAFWLATQSRGLFRLDRQSGQLSQFVHQPNQRESLNNNALYCLSTDQDNPNWLWVGTMGGGLCRFDKRSGRCRRITEQDGLPNDVIYSAIPDELGNLWVGTNKGLCRMNRKTFKTRTYTTEDGLLANEFNRFHYLQLPGSGSASGQIIMGGIEGIMAFQPTQLQKDTFQPSVELTDLYINNKVAQPGSSSFLNAPIQAVDKLSLPYDQNFLTVQFAALQFNRPGKNRYRYRLKGVDKDWVETAQPQAIYTA